VITTALKNLCRIFGSRFLGCYWFRNEVGKGVDYLPCLPVSYEKVHFITDIVLSAIVAAFNSIQPSDILFCELIKSAKNFVSRRTKDPSIEINTVLSFLIAYYSMVRQSSSSNSFEGRTSQFNLC